MTAWWNALSALEQVFYCIAIPATVVLALQIILLLFGLGHEAGFDGGHDFDSGTDFDHDLDHDMDHDLDHDHELGHEHDVHADGLRLLTVRGIVAFLAITGWVGVAMLDFGVTPYISVPVALLAGCGALLLVALFMKFAWNMQQTGNLDSKNAVGVTGQVYVPILEGGKGKVTLVFQERFVEMDAVTADSQPLKMGQRVKVVDTADDNTLVVEAV